METFVKFNNFKNLQKFLKYLRKGGYKKEIFEVKRIISTAYNSISYYIHIRYAKNNDEIEIEKEIFPNLELQGFWVIRKENDSYEKFYIKEYEFKEVMEDENSQ